MNGLDLNHDVQICNITASDPANVAYYTCSDGSSNGRSMASPHVAGVVALMEQASGGTLTPDQALRVLKQTAQPLAGYLPFEVGAGYVDALAAVEAVRR